MSQHDDQIERLIAKSLDGEISPAEQRELNQHLQDSAEARTTFDRIQTVHRACSEAIKQDVLSQAQPPEVILRRARQLAAKAPEQPGPFERFLRSQFAAGLAAGLLFATLLLAWFDREPPRSREVAQSTSPAPNEVRPLPIAPPPTITVGDPVQRGMDYFVITDEQGNRWLIEREREDTLRPERERGDF